MRLVLIFIVALLIVFITLSCSKKTTEPEEKKVATPSFNPADVTYPSTQNVSISTTTDNATIRYTTNGSEPTDSSAVYHSPIVINSTTTIKARAFLSGWTSSDIASATYTITGAVATPTFNPAGGTFSSTQNVSISTSTPNAMICYTTNGSEPTSTSTIYSTPINVSSTTTIKARAFLSGWTSSDIASATFTITEAVATPTFNPPGGTYDTIQIVSMSTSTPNARIRYTTNGSEPTSTSTIYSSPISVSSMTTIKAKGFRTGWIASSTASAIYNVTPSEAVATPTINPPGGIYYETKKVSISTTTPNATIRYTTDGSEPTSTSTIYSSLILVSSTTTIKAKGFCDGWTASSTANTTYTFIPIETVATPTMNPTGGAYGGTMNVSISTTTPNATIRYTTSGSNPTSSSPIYSSPISVSSTTTIKAKGFRDGWIASSTASASYIIRTKPPAADFVFVQGGTFNNGTSNVTLSSFYIEKYEVTQAAYNAVMGGGTAYFSYYSNRPMELITWFSAIVYCNRRSMQEGLTLCYSYSSYGTNPDNWPSGWYLDYENHTNVSCNWSANGYRLPTEMEWMYAAKGGNQSQGYTYSGSNNIDDVAWYCANSNSQTWNVGLKDPNELGTFDMSGNVCEWCWDIYAAYPSGNQTNPTGAMRGNYRVIRGGSWGDYASSSTVYYRSRVHAMVRRELLGFRCVRVSL